MKLNSYTVGQVVVIGLILSFQLASQTSTATADTLVRISEPVPIDFAGNYAGRVWYLSVTGLYEVRDENATRLIMGDESAVNVVAEVWGDVWIGTERGLFLDGGKRSYEYFIGDNVTSVASDEHTAWIGTNSALYTVTAEDPNNVSIVLERGVRSLTLTAGRLWVSTDRSIEVQSRYDGSWKPSRVIHEKDVKITKIVEAGEKFWLTTTRSGLPGPCYHIDENEGVRKIPGMQKVNMVVDVDDEVLFVTRHGISRLVDIETLHTSTADGPYARLGTGEVVSSLHVAHGDLWFGTTDRVYKKNIIDNRNSYQELPSEETEKMGVSGMFTAQEHVWVWGETGLYRFEENVDIDVATNIHLSPLIGKFSFDTMVRITRVQYSDADGKDPFAGIADRGFEVIVRLDQESLDKDIQEGKFAPADNYARAVPKGWHDIHVAVRDASGNLRIVREKSVFFFPLALVFSVLLGVIGAGVATLFFYWTTAMFCLLLPPWLGPMSILNSLLSKGHFGLHLLLASGYLRKKRLLNRYSRHLERRLDRSTHPGCADRDEPFAGLFGATSEARCLQVVSGDPSRRRSYLRLLARRAIRQKIFSGQDRLMTPIYVSLAPYLNKEQSDPVSDTVVEAVLGQLANFGDVNDPVLGRSLVDHGDFIFIFDEVEKVDARGRSAILQFIDRYERENLIIVGTNHDCKLESVDCLHSVDVEEGSDVEDQGAEDQDTGDYAEDQDAEDQDTGDYAEGQDAEDQDTGDYAKGQDAEEAPAESTSTKSTG